ncbi:hypothetical protein L9F63_002317, partial [Diploptera punctata]
FMKFMHQVGEGEVTIESGQVIYNKENIEEDNVEINKIDPTEEANNWASEFEAISKDELLITKTEEAKIWATDFESGPSEEVLKTDESTLWTKEFEKSTSASSNKQDEENSINNDFWSKLQDEWQKLAKDDGAAHSWLTEFSDYSDPFKEYSFETDNPMRDNQNALEEGKQKLEAGDLPSAVLCFEAACQQEPDNSEAWQLLGTTQAENEQIRDYTILTFFSFCLELEPSNLTALMALAVSYTNESYQNQACHALMEWLHQNPKYSDLVSKTDELASSKIGNVSSLLMSDIHEKVKNMYIEAARRNPSDKIDSDVQCGLGVLFNLSNEYDKAVDCFKAALQDSSEDFRMWNRLGATLANGSRSEEAVDAYHNALQLSPGFIRARYNLGITCVNLAAYKEAAEHLLTALNQQAAGRGIQGQKSWSAMSNSIWSTLRLVMSLLDRHDLYDALDNRDLKKLNDEFGIE